MPDKKISGINKAEFVTSSTDVGSSPDVMIPEYAFIGRSNVGKSSLINMLTSTKGLAKISQTPGKTRLINHFMINDAWYLVDLPGYGYAKISQSERRKWRAMINAFLLKRKNLVCTFILVDIRHEPQKPDMEFMEWMSMKQIPFVIAFTKADKLSKTKLEESVSHYVKEMMTKWEDMPQYFITSAVSGLGRSEILQYISINNGLYEKYFSAPGRP
ncbi:MAG: ribosome biogenesis GTP-binding protein YihA/YsxC [Bacteroidales bacterium]|nr:ribosome biogenesis GTP-binding protein YihA/YsxC [Bacteroidales bacterium]